MFNSRKKLEAELKSLSSRLSATQEYINNDRHFTNNQIRNLTDRISFLEDENIRLKGYLEIEFVRVPTTYKVVSIEQENSD